MSHPDLETLLRVAFERRASLLGRWRALRREDFFQRAAMDRAGHLWDQLQEHGESFLDAIEAEDALVKQAAALAARRLRAQPDLAEELGGLVETCCVWTFTRYGWDFALFEEGAHWAELLAAGSRRDLSTWSLDEGEATDRVYAYCDGVEGAGSRGRTLIPGKFSLKGTSPFEIQNAHAYVSRAVANEIRRARAEEQELPGDDVLDGGGAPTRYSPEAIRLARLAWLWTFEAAVTAKRPRPVEGCLSQLTDELARGRKRLHQPRSKAGMDCQVRAAVVVGLGRKMKAWGAEGPPEVGAFTAPRRDWRAPSMGLPIPEAERERLKEALASSGALPSEVAALLDRLVGGEVATPDLWYRLAEALAALPGADAAPLAEPLLEGMEVAVRAALERAAPHLTALLEAGLRGALLEATEELSADPCGPGLGQILAGGNQYFSNRGPRRAAQLAAFVQVALELGRLARGRWSGPPDPDPGDRAPSPDASDDEGRPGDAPLPAQRFGDVVGDVRAEASTDEEEALLFEVRQIILHGERPSQAESPDDGLEVPLEQVLDAARAGAPALWNEVAGGEVISLGEVEASRRPEPKRSWLRPLALAAGLLLTASVGRFMLYEPAPGTLAQRAPWDVHASLMVPGPDGVTPVALGDPGSTLKVPRFDPEHPEAGGLQLIASVTVQAAPDGDDELEIRGFIVGESQLSLIYLGAVSPDVGIELWPEGPTQETFGVLSITELLVVAAPASALEALGDEVEEDELKALEASGTPLWSARVRLKAAR